MKSFIQKHFTILLVVLVIALGATSFYFYKKTIATNATPEQVAQAELKALVEQVGKLMILPTGETPTLATVADPVALKDQAFFMDAKKGDKVLIYSVAKKAVLFDPVLNKIVNITPLTIGDNKAASVPKTDTTTTTTKKKK